MKKKVKSILGVAIALCLVSSFPVVLSAAQGRSSWGTYIDFWTDVLRTNVVELDSDSVSHVTWTGKEINYDFKLKFTVQTVEGKNVSDQQYLYSGTDLNREHTFNASCIQGRRYQLVAARENMFDDAIYCTGNWEP